MYKSTIIESQEQIPEITQSLDQLAREGARRMILAALALKVEQYVEKLRHLRDENGHALVVRNGKAEPRTVSLAAGGTKFQAPRVDDRRPDHRSTSRILPPYMRRSPRLNEALPRTSSGSLRNSRPGTPKRWTP